MNFYLVPFYFAILASLTSAMFYQPCDCPQCSDYTLEVERCTCCVYLLNGKRSVDTHTVVHNQENPSERNVYHKSTTHGKIPASWRNIFSAKGHSTEAGLTELYESQTNERRSMPVYERIGMKIHQGNDEPGAFILDIDGF